MAEAARERREVLAKVDRGQLAASPAGLKVNELLDLYLDGMDADQNLALKTRFDYRQYADDYIRPYIGDRRVRDITPEVILAWQRKLLKEGGAKRKKGKDGKPGQGKPLSPNTVNRIRAPLSATFKLAVQAGMIPINPLLQAPRPKPQRKIPKYWSPEEARKFLALMEGDRTWPIWAFLLGSGLRIGELVSLRWRSVDLKNRRVRIVDFVSTLGYDMHALERQEPGCHPDDRPRRRACRRPAPAEGPAEDRAVGATEWIESDFVFTRPDGGQYHPMNLSRLLATYTTELDVPRLTAHGLRHTSATLMLASGVPPKVAAERLGHADATLFTNLYSHVTPTMQREAAEKIGSMLFGDGQ